MFRTDVRLRPDPEAGRIEGQSATGARIGVLGAATAFRLGLRELEGTNIVITCRSLTHGACNSFAGSQLIVCLPRLNAATG